MRIYVGVWMLVFLIAPLLIFSQNPLTNEEIFEDFQAVKNILREGHPSLHDYTSASQWDTLVTDFETDIIPSLKTRNDFYRSIAKLCDHVHDGHLLILRPALDTIPELFPLLLKIINEKFYTDTEDYGIPVGSEILAIDNRSSREIRTRLMKYAPSDGYNTSKKDRQVEREFSMLYFYEFGIKETFKILYSTPLNDTLERKVNSAPFEEIGRRFPMRQSYFSNYHKAEDKRQFVNGTVGKKETFVYFLDSLQTAVLTVNSFGLEQDDFKANLKSLFKEIKRKKSTNLVIDLRQNEGGYPENSNFLFSYIAKNTFVQPYSQEVVASSPLLKALSKEVIGGSTYKSYFNTYFKDASKESHEWIAYAPKNEASMEPAKRGFKGQTFVLIEGRTFSAGATFALNCKNQGITLVGEETGGGYYFHTGVYPLLYELPNSRLRIIMSFVKVRKTTKDKSVKKGSGVLPDFEVNLTIDDLIDGRDSQLDFVLNQIAKKDR